jgi:DNA gyrase subunit A
MMKEFELDAEQTDAILDAQLYKIARLEIQKILDELKERKRRAEEIEGILASEKKLWGVVKGEFEKLIEAFPERRKTRMASDEDVLEFNEEAYIVRENTNVVLTRDGWLKRVGRLASVESTRVREGDEVTAVVPGSTLDNVVFFADDGTAYTMRINEVPASSGYGEPITKFFKLADQVRIVAAVTTDPRFTPADGEAGPYILVATSAGNVLRTPLAAFRPESTKVGRRYVKLDAGDKVVFVRLLRDETGVMLAARGGHVIHFPVEQVSVLSGSGKGVVGIRLEGNDACIGGTAVGGRFDKLIAETSGGVQKECGPGAFAVQDRGGKGKPVPMRGELVRVLPPPIELVNWDEVDGRQPRAKDADGKGNGTLFE